MKSYLTVYLLLICQFVFSQTKEDNLRLKVLAANKVGKEFKFNNEGVEYFTYLGTLTSQKHDGYKILISKRIWGQTHRATSRIVVYNLKNKYLGNYYLAFTSDLPTKIIRNSLFFTNQNKGCDSHKHIFVQFANGPPKTIFLECDSADAIFEKP